MGTSSDAILTYGAPFEEDEFPQTFFEYDGDTHIYPSLEDWLMERHGTVDSPWCDDGDGRKPGHNKLWVEDYFREQKKLMAECPARIVHHCSGDYGMFILSVHHPDRNYTHTAKRGYPLDINPHHKLAVNGDHEKAFMAWCAEHSIELPGQPRWVLCSYWG